MSRGYHSGNPATDEAFHRYIAGRIRDEREALGFSQAELAIEVGVTRTSIVNIETGRQHPPVYTLYHIARALAVPVAALLPE